MTSWTTSAGSATLSLMTGRSWAGAAAYVAVVEAVAVLAIVRPESGLWFVLGIVLTLPAGAALLPVLYLAVQAVVLLVGPGSNSVVDAGAALLFGVAAAVNVWVVRQLATEVCGAWRRCRLRRSLRPT